MSTRSVIAIIDGDGNGQAIYCHSDGYPGAPHGVGHKLLSYWDDPDKMRELMQLGNLNRLGTIIGDRIAFTRPDNPDALARWQGQCLAYGRDRGDPNAGATAFDGGTDALFARDWSLDFWAEWVYAYTPDGWFASKMGGFMGMTPHDPPRAQPLAELVARNTAEREARRQA